MATILDFSLDDPKATDSKQSLIIKHSDGVPVTLGDIGGAVNDAFLIAEAIGVYYDMALACVNRITGLFTSIEEPCFTDEDLPILREFLEPVVSALDRGLDSEGHPRGDIGEQLTRFPSFLCDPQGCLVLRRNRRRLLSLRYDLRALLQMIAFAIDHDLRIKVTAR
jgi:hypothetical protein